MDREEQRGVCVCALMDTAAAALTRGAGVVGDDVPPCSSGLSRERWLSRRGVLYLVSIGVCEGSTPRHVTSHGTNLRTNARPFFVARSRKPKAGVGRAAT